VLGEIRRIHGHEGGQLSGEGAAVTVEHSSVSRWHKVGTDARNKSNLRQHRPTRKPSR
jgi:hypothetical protein